MRIPRYYTADELNCWDVQIKIEGGLWTQARPMGLHSYSLIHRLHAAWSVFTGRNDVLVWLGKQK